jgi:hypothetical protein
MLLIRDHGPSSASSSCRYLVPTFKNQNQARSGISDQFKYHTFFNFQSCTYFAKYMKCNTSLQSKNGTLSVLKLLLLLMF